MRALSFDEKYEALGRDSIYGGVFITAVVTTGVFCRPTCRARKPLAKNVIFYDTPTEAINNGFRPCKICRPMEPEGETPAYIKDILKELQADPFLKIKDYDLRQRGLGPNTIRRWFKQNHNMTFHAYQRMIRINRAYNKIKGGNSVTNTAFGAGYESLSGFNDSWKNVFGQAPKDTHDKAIINITRFTTKLGPMFACATSQGLCLLEFTDRRALESEFQDLQKRRGSVILPGVNIHLENIQEKMAQYFSGQRQNFGIKLDMVGTDFQKSVWTELLKIPYGKTRTYTQLAQSVGRSTAIRAAASANGYNKIGILIPCHRIIGVNGDLTGYGGGLARKKYLLELEQFK